MKVTAKVTRAQDWWAVEVLEVPGVFTQAKRLDQVEGMVKDAVALMEDVDLDDVEVELEPVLPSPVVEHIKAAQALAATAANLQIQASSANRAVVKELRETGLSVRDVALLLHVTPQRVSQLAPIKNDKARKPARRKQRA